MAEGGFFRGQPNAPTASELRSEESTISRYPTMVWGRICDTPKVVVDRNSVKATFTVKYGSSRHYSEKYKEGSGKRFCEAWGVTDVSAVMAACDNGESVVCFGEWKVVKYAPGTKKRKGRNKGQDKKDYHEFHCHAVIPMGLMAYLVKLYNSPSIRKLIEDDENDAPDPLEAFDDIEF